jgi:hypothetical protein
MRCPIALLLPRFERLPEQRHGEQQSEDVTITAVPRRIRCRPAARSTLSNIQQTLNVPGTIFVAGYNLGLLSAGVNNVPAPRGRSSRHQHGRGDTGDELA